MPFFRFFLFFINLGIVLNFLCFFGYIGPLFSFSSSIIPLVFSFSPKISLLEKSIFFKILHFISFNSFHSFWIIFPYALKHRKPRRPSGPPRLSVFYISLWPYGSLSNKAFSTKSGSSASSAFSRRQRVVVLILSACAARARLPPAWRSALAMAIF